MAVRQLDCVVAPPDNSGITNHVELRVSQNQIDIYATDAGVTPSSANLKRIAVVTDANLSLTRGLIWLQDVHYNADKGESGPNVPSQKQHTFVWDNVAFDGPFTYRDFSYDALDVNQANAATRTVDLGKPSLPNQTASWNVLNMPANPKAASVRVLFNFYQQSPARMLNVIVNGHAHPTPWPYPGHPSLYVAYLCRDHSHHRSRARHQCRSAWVRSGDDNFQRQYRARGCSRRGARAARIK